MVDEAWHRARMPYDCTVTDTVRSYCRGSRRWRRRGLALLVTVSLLTNVWFVMTQEQVQIGYWRSREGKAAYDRAYDAAMTGLPPREQVDVTTDYGIVRVYRFGPAGTQGAHEAQEAPIVLLPGWGSGVPMWTENLPGLRSGGRTVYAFDALGDAGRSVQTLPLTSPQAQADWIAQTLGGLGVDRAHVVGHSFGGWSATNLAIHHPERVATLSLLDPVQTFSDLPWQMYVKSIPAALPLLPQSWRDRALADIGGSDEPIDKGDPVVAMIDAGTQHYVSKRSFPQRPTREQLRALRMPVYAAMAGDSVMTADPADAAARARELVPDLQIGVWPGASHSLPMEQPERVAHELHAFVTGRDG